MKSKKKPFRLVPIPSERLTPREFATLDEATEEAHELALDYGIESIVFGTGPDGKLTSIFVEP